VGQPSRLQNRLRLPTRTKGGKEGLIPRKRFDGCQPQQGAATSKPQSRQRCWTMSSEGKKPAPPLGKVWPAPAGAGIDTHTGGHAGRYRAPAQRGARPLVVEHGEMRAVLKHIGPVAASAQGPIKGLKVLAHRRRGGSRRIRQSRGQSASSSFPVGGAPGTSVEQEACRFPGFLGLAREAHLPR